MADSKDYILENMKRDFKEAKIRGFYVIPTDEEYDQDSGYNLMHIVGYNFNEDNTRIYYDFGDCHDVVSLMNFGMSGVTLDIEHENGLVRVFWNDRNERKIDRIDAFLSIFTIYGKEII